LEAECCIYGTTCGATIGAWCTAGRRRARALHVPRTQGAPPVELAHLGDLVLVRLQGQSGELHRLAQLVGLGEHVRVRLWARDAFARPRLLERLAVVRIAPEDDPRVAAARAGLLLERSAEEHVGAVRDAFGAGDGTVVPPQQVEPPAPAAESFTTGGHTFTRRPPGPALITGAMAEDPAPPAADPWSTERTRGATTTTRKGW
jgi:hypothetical protein